MHSGHTICNCEQTNPLIASGHGHLHHHVPETMDQESQQNNIRWELYNRIACMVSYM